MESHMSRFRVRLSEPRVTPPTTPSSRSASGAHSPRRNATRRRTACDRCRRLKRECIRAGPQCDSCARAKLNCSLRWPSAPHEDRSREELSTRLAWMEELIIRGNLLPHGQAIGESPTGTHVTGIDMEQDGQLMDTHDDAEPLEGGSRLTPPTTLAGRSLNSLSPGNDSSVEFGAVLTQPVVRIGKITHAIESVRVPSTTASLPSIPVQTVESFLHSRSPISQYQDSETFIRAYFRDVNQAYPFLEMDKLLESLDVKGDTVLSTPEGDIESIILYLVMAIGYTTLERTGRLPPGDAADGSAHASPFVINYKEVLSQCLLLDSIDSTQALALLAIHSLSEAEGFIRPIIEVLAQQALRLGLTRRATADEGCDASEAEHRHRLFWSIFSLDQTMAASTGTPAALNLSTGGGAYGGGSSSSCIDIPLPGLTIDEFTSPDRAHFSSTLQVARHIFELRILEDRVLREVHLRAPEQESLTQLRMTELRMAIENWYSSGCLLQSTESVDDVSIHIHISWLAARYYNLLLMLHYPSQSNAATAVSHAELLSLAQKHVHANNVRFQQRQLPLNKATLYRIFSVCLVFMYLQLATEDSDNEMMLSAKEEMGMCRDMLAAYPAAWDLAHKAATAVQQLLAWPVEARTAKSFAPCSARPSENSVDNTLLRGTGESATSEADRAWRLAVKLRFIELEERILGRGSVYRCIAVWFGQPEDSRSLGQMSAPELYPRPTARFPGKAARPQAPSHVNTGRLWGLQTYDHRPSAP